MKIKETFDGSRDIYRPIEKVITYGALDSVRLKKEISEYVVTEHIEDQFEKLMTDMLRAMDEQDGTVNGVWVSGFYGSGKSSFSKYLALALDDSVRIDGRPFIDLLKERFTKPQTKALLTSLAKKHPSAIVMIDLASEQLAGATMETISNVLYYKVLQWAGYSRNLKVAALERRLQQVGKFAEFEAAFKELTETDWAEEKNDTLVVDTVLPELAHQFFPNLFKTETSFSTATSEDIVFERDRVKEMLAIVREKSGKDAVVFVVDEVGQYVGGSQPLILNLDGLAKNLKEIGGGKAWILATAQQTLTEDDPRAALNSPELYKLNARFPLSINLESSDIKEICYRRLLGKSTEGEKTLGALFDQHGQALRFNTKLTDARHFEGDFTKEQFVDLYPFLPAHFEILLLLLGSLAKSTGGVGLRSAIKIVQEILIEKRNGADPAAERDVGWLASMVTIYDALDHDIPRAFPAIAKAVGKVQIRFPDNPVALQTAKTVAILKMIQKIVPATPQNVAALMQASVGGASLVEEVKKAADLLIADSVVPFCEKDGQYDFYSERLNEIDNERSQIQIRLAEKKRIMGGALKNVFSPLPSAKIFGSLSVTAGLKYFSNGMASSIDGERNAVQLVVEYVPQEHYDDRVREVVEESRLHDRQMNLYVLGRDSTAFMQKAEEIYRCNEIAERHRNDADTEIKEYNAAQRDRAIALAQELERLMKGALQQGSFVFRGQSVAVETIAADLVEASKKEIASIGEQIYDHYQQAPGRYETNLAEKFLRAATGGLKAVTSKVDPLGLVVIEAGTPRIKTESPALTGVSDYLQINDTVEGKRLQEHFGTAPYGWSSETTLYLVAAMLVGGMIKLKVSGKVITQNGQQAVDALSTNMKFKNVGVTLRLERPSMEMLVRAAERLTSISATSVIPLEDAIAKAAMKTFPEIQLKLGALPERLKALGLPGADEVESALAIMTDILSTDASDAPQRLGGEECKFIDDVKWGLDADQMLKAGLEETVKRANDWENKVNGLQDIGKTGELKVACTPVFEEIRELRKTTDFISHGDEIDAKLETIEKAASEVASAMDQELVGEVVSTKNAIQAHPDWKELAEEERTGVLGALDGIEFCSISGVDGVTAHISIAYAVRQQVSSIVGGVHALAAKRRADREAAARAKAEAEGKKLYEKTVTISGALKSAAEIEGVIRELSAAKSEGAGYKEMVVTVKVEG